MIKHLMAVLALGAALLACSPAGGSSASPDLTNPTDMVDPSMSMDPATSMDPSMSVESASPSP